MSYKASEEELLAEDSYIIDKFFVKGIKADRDQNDTNFDYLYVDNHENMGLRFYLHKYFIGLHPYYMKLKQDDYIEAAHLKYAENMKVDEYFKN